MIHGVGVDIVEVDRIRDSVKNFGEEFLNRVFTIDEIEYCMKRRDPHPSLAVRFAAKEALIKALTCAETVPLRDIEVIISDDGKPSISPSEYLQDILDAASVTGSHLSLSHERDYAIAYLVLTTTSE